MDYKKFNSFEFKCEFEKLFIKILGEMTSPQCSFLNLPSNSSFTGCVKEILNCLQKEKEGIITSEYSNDLIANFYQWMERDDIIKEYDFLFYTQILQTLKQYSEGQKVSKTEKYAFFEYVNKSKIFIYRKNLYNKIIDFATNDMCNDDAYKCIVLFINELLAVGISYPFLWFIYSKYLDGWFKDFNSLLQYLWYANLDCYDIYIPINNFDENEKDIFEKKQQKIEEADGKFYCKVYKNRTCDFYYLIKENIVRIESLFNIIRFYRNSKIGFSFSLPIIIHSKFFDKTFELSMTDIVCYNSKSYGKDFLINSVDSLEKLKEKEETKSLYHKLLNVISYAERDQDVINPSSYVDNWISLETLISMSGRTKGFDGVNNFIPKMISVKFVLDNLFHLFYEIKYELKGVCIISNNIETFVGQLHNQTIDIDSIRDPYTNITVRYLSKVFSTVNSFKKYLDSVEKEIKIELLRIYILRNEYVHASNIQAFTSMQAYKLKHILTASIDEFFRMLSNRADKDQSDYGMVFDTFSEILNRYETRTAAFTTLLETKKYFNSSLAIHKEIRDLDIGYHTFIFNVLKNNTGLFRKYEMD